MPHSLLYGDSIHHSSSTFSVGWYSPVNAKRRFSSSFTSRVSPVAVSCRYSAVPLR